MKLFLGTDITHNKDNDQYDGECFIVARPSDENAEALQTASNEFAENIVKSVNPLPKSLRILEVITGIGGVSILCGILKSITSEDAVSLAQGYQNAPILFWTCGVFLLVWLGLFLYSGKLKKQAEQSYEESNLSARLDTIADAVFDELGVPDEYAAVDLINVSYKIKDGEVIHKSSNVDISPYHNFEYRTFVKDGNLCFADVEGKYAIPLSSLSCIRTVNKKIVLPLWYKDIEPDQGIYRQYKLKADNLDNIMQEPYHILEFTHEGETWGIYFPCYELPVMEELTGLKAEHNEKNP